MIISRGHFKISGSDLDFTQKSLHFDEIEPHFNVFFFPDAHLSFYTSCVHMYFNITTCHSVS